MHANSIQHHEFINYSGLYREKNTHKENYIYCETIESRSKEFNWEVDAHFHSSLYQVFFVESGYATFYTADEQICLEAPFMCFIPPLSIHGFHFGAHIDGRILTFSDFYTETLHERYPNILHALETIFVLKGDALPTFRESFNKIHTEFNESKVGKEIILEHMLYLLVLQFYRYSNEQPSLKSGHNNNLYYFKKFQHLIKVSKSPFTSLQVYADHLHITAKHLNRICRSLKQMSALQVVQVELILKAKAHLYHFNSNISEIAYELGFDDPSYFTRLFKKHTGLTPNEYRKQIPLAKIEEN